MESIRLGAFECTIQFGSDETDTFVLSGTGVNTGLELTEDQCQAMTDEYASELYEAWEEHRQSQAEAWADARDDR